MELVGIGYNTGGAIKLIIVYFDSWALLKILMCATTKNIDWGYAGKDVNAEVSWGFVWVIILGLAAAGVGGYAVYKYRIRVSLYFLCSIHISLYMDLGALI